MSKKRLAKREREFTFLVNFWRLMSNKQWNRFAAGESLDRDDRTLRAFAEAATRSDMSIEDTVRMTLFFFTHRDPLMTLLR